MLSLKAEWLTSTEATEPLPLDSLESAESTLMMVPHQVLRAHQSGSSPSSEGSGSAWSSISEGGQAAGAAVLAATCPTERPGGIHSTSGVVTGAGQGAHTHISRLPRPTTNSHGTPPTRRHRETSAVPSTSGAHQVTEDTGKDLGDNIKHNIT